MAGTEHEWIARSLGPWIPTTRQIGTFPIIGVLGTRGMGRVYLGIIDGGYIAVKQVSPVFRRRLGFRPRFRREVETMYKVPASIGPRVLAHDSMAVIMFSHPRRQAATEVFELSAKAGQCLVGLLPGQAEQPVGADRIAMPVDVRRERQAACRVAQSAAKMPLSAPTAVMATA